VPDNVLIYATSNRRHLMPEYFPRTWPRDTVDGEIHPGEATEEKISLSERFGLWISFYPFSQDDYLNIVQHWARSFGAEKVIAASEREALNWALMRGSRSGRGSPGSSPATWPAAKAERKKTQVSKIVEVAAAVMLRARRPRIPARPAPGRQGLCRLLGISRRQGRARRNACARR
jgi:hypothetical protein